MAKKSNKSINVRLGLLTAGFEKGLRVAQIKLKKFGKTMSRFGSSMTRNVTLPLGLVGVAGIKMASELETSFSKIENLVGMSGELFDGFKKQIKGLSSEVATSQKSLADALFVITSAGVRGAEAMDILSAAAKSSQVGMGETEAIARGITGAMNSYAKSNLTAARSADIMMAIVREGNLVAEDLAPTLGRVTGMAAELGISFEELGANIATFTRLGVPTEEAVTGLRGVMSAVLKPTKAAEDVLASITMTSSDLRKMVGKEGLHGTLMFLVDALKSNEKGLSSLFGNVRALSNVLGTAGAQGESYAKVLDSITRSTGMVDDSFENVSKISGFKFKKMLVDLQNVGIELGQAFLPVALKVVNLLTGLVRAFKDASPEMKIFGRTIGLVAVALGPVASLLGAMATRMALLMSPVYLVIAAFAGLVYLMIKWKKEASNALLPIINGFILLWDAAVGVVKTVKSLAALMSAMAAGNWQLAAAVWVTEFNGAEGLAGAWKQLQENFTEGAGNLDLVTALDIEAGLAGLEDSLVTGIANIGKSIGISTGSIADSFVKVEYAVVAAKEQFASMPERVIKDTSKAARAIKVNTDSMKKSFESVKSTVELMNEAIRFAVEDGIVESFTLLGEAMESGNFDPRKFGEAMLVTFITIAQQLGRLAIAHGIAIEAIFDSFKLGGVPAIIAGGALLVAAGIAKSRLSSIRDNNLPALAEGGLAFGPTLAMVGDNRNASIDPEVVAPLSKLKAMMGGGSQNVIVTGRLSGADLLISNERATGQRSRYRGF